MTIKTPYDTVLLKHDRRPLQIAYQRGYADAQARYKALVEALQDAWSYAKSLNPSGQGRWYADLEQQVNTALAAIKEAP